jgi:subtilisin family serine protease
VVLFAAGNDDRVINDDELQALPEVVNVGAINNFDDSTPFTNFGNSLDIVAPTGTLTTDISGSGGDDPGDYTSLFGGTSSACPVAAGIAALLVSAAPDQTSTQIRQLMIDTARAAPYAVPDANGHDPVYGFGIVDPVPALRSALGLPPEVDAGAPDASSDAGTPPNPTSDDGGGCSCSAVGRRVPSSALPLLLGLALLLSRRRHGVAAR